MRLTSFIETQQAVSTSESVTEGHPDKMCDQIADGVLDALVARDPMSRVACETACTTGLVVVIGDIASSGYADIAGIALRAYLCPLNGMLTLAWDCMATAAEYPLCRGLWWPAAGIASARPKSLWPARLCGALRLRGVKLSGEVHFNTDGLVPAVVQHVRTRQVLLLGYMSRESLDRTLKGEHVWFWNRSRRELWEKGATSGNHLVPKQLVADCDGDTLLVLAEPTGRVCHTGQEHCFYQGVFPPNVAVLEELAAVVAQRHRDRPEGSYTAKLLNEGIDRIAKKIGEEAAEVIIAGKNAAPSEITWEVADLWYHTLVLLESTGVPLTAIYEELAKRRK